MRTHPKNKRRATAALEYLLKCMRTAYFSIQMYRVRLIKTECRGKINAMEKNTMLICEHCNKWDLDEYLHAK